MSDDGDCCYPIRDTPTSDAQAMTRAQVEQMGERLKRMFFIEDCKAFLVHDAAQRETIRRLEASEQLFRNEMDRMLDKLESILGKPRNEVGYENGLAQLQARLTASEAAKKWTTARPTVAGVYWWRANRTAAAQIIKVLDDFTAESMTGCSDHVNEIGGEFQGPLTPGEE